MIVDTKLECNYNLI